MPSRTFPILFDQGLTNSPEKSTLQEGELNKAEGCEYRLGTSEIHKQPGRSIANSSGIGSSLLNIHRFRYEDVTDVFVAYASDGKIYEATPSTSMTFSSTNTLSGLDTSAVPVFTSFNDRWIMCNGVDSNYIREPSTVPDASSKWRTLGMKRALGRSSVAGISSAGGGYTSWVDGTDSETGAWQDPENVEVTTSGGIRQLGTDTSTWSVGQAANTDSQQHVWSFADADFSSTNARLVVTHSGSATGGRSTLGAYAGSNDSSRGVRGQGPNIPTSSDSDVDSSNSEATWKIEYSTDGINFTNILFERNSSYNFKTSTSTILTADYGANFKVRATITSVSGEDVKTMRVSNIGFEPVTGSDTQSTIDYDVRYIVTERYYDSNKEMHESLPTDEGVLVAGSYYGATVTLPTSAANTFSTEFVIYRSLDEQFGGWPYFWEIATVPIDDAGEVYIDNFSLSLAVADDKSNIIGVVSPQFPDGQILDFPLNSPPPKSKLAIPFQGCVVYLPVEIPRRVWYSLPTESSNVAAEQVPLPYNLLFETPYNDTTVSAALANGGRSLIVYFNSYTMLVTSLPLASDSGRFDTTVREYVSEKRGCAGKLASTTFTPEEGSSTLAASVDNLGLWITNGVGLIKSWSNDLNWESIFDGVDLTSCILIDNPEMRRLEMLYNDNGWKEYHFFYGVMKRNGQPKITGPHAAGWRCKHYTNLDGDWVGWSGDDGSDGYVFNERTGDEDQSEAYSSSKEVPFDVETGDRYPYGLNNSALPIFLYPHFSNTSSKNITITTTFDRDGDDVSNPQTSSKTFNTTTKKKLYLGVYCDKFRVRVQDITNTSLPSLVSMEYTARLLQGEGLGDESG